MTPADFLAVLETELAARFAVCDGAELRAFLEAAWPLIEDDPDPARWATAFLEAKRMARAAGTRLAVERN
jgi:hypothetical protein